MNTLLLFLIQTANPLNYTKPHIYPPKLLQKKNRVYKGPKVKSAGIRNVTQRNALGEAFGTKKAKSAITNLERTELILKNCRTLKWILLILLKESTRDLPAQEDGVDRPAPLANVDATNVEDIYPLENIIPEKIGNIFVLVPFLLQKSIGKIAIYQIRIHCQTIAYFDSAKTQKSCKCFLRIPFIGCL